LKIDGGPCADATITYAGQIYHTVQIAKQCWLRENLNVGTMIQISKDQTDNGIVENIALMIQQHIAINMADYIDGQKQFNIKTTLQIHPHQIRHSAECSGNLPNRLAYPDKR